MAEYQLTLMDRQRIARDTVAFWFDANGARYEFRAGQHADFVFGSESDNSLVSKTEGWNLLKSIETAVTQSGKSIGG
jgi:hypothetical protein